jgi:hypothetical protein
MGSLGLSREGVLVVVNRPRKREVGLGSRFERPNLIFSVGFRDGNIGDGLWIVTRLAI